MSTDDESPDELRPDAGVKRLNKKPLIILASVLTVIIVLLTEGVMSRGLHSRGSNAGGDEKHRAADKEAAADVKKDAPKAGPIPERPPKMPNQADSGLIAAAPGSDRLDIPIGSQTPSRSDKEEMESARKETLRNTALTAVTNVATFDAVAEPQAKPGLNPEGSLAAGTANESKTTTAMAPGTTTDQDPNLQARKETFATTEKNTGYLSAQEQHPISRFEIKAGTIIPAIMISGINSDLPGEIIAHVSQNVYDSATGEYLLIPQGTKLVGAYDSHVAIGQERVQVAWTRLNYPDSSTLDLGNMPGADQAGYGGFHDQVNNHFWKIFGDTLMLSLLSAGAQLSQPQTTSATGVPTAGQTVAASMGQQFAATGAEITKRNMQIQPTLEIRPGYQFNVMVAKDVILEPYTER